MTICYFIKCSLTKTSFNHFLQSTVLHLVAAVLVKTSLDKARSYAKRHLDQDSDASTSVADDTVEEQCIENINLNND